MKTAEQTTATGITAPVVADAGPNDINSIHIVERIIEIKYPDDETKLLGVRVGLKSINDPSMKHVKRSITNRRLSLEAKGKHFKADEIEDNRDNIVFDAMTSWEWYNCKFIDGSLNPPFNKKNALDTFEKHYWFRNQLDEALAEEERFFEVSKPA